MPSKGESFLEGAVIGAVLSAAAAIFLQSKKGKELQKDVSGKMAGFYAYIAPKLENMKSVGEKEYFDFIETAAKNYAKTKKFTDTELEILIRDAKSTWRHLKKHAK